jgi:hypothetical protein
MVGDNPMKLKSDMISGSYGAPKQQNPTDHQNETADRSEETERLDGNETFDEHTPLKEERTTDKGPPGSMIASSRIQSTENRYGDQCQGMHKQIVGRQVKIVELAVFLQNRQQEVRTQCPGYHSCQGQGTANCDKRLGHNILLKKEHDLTRVWPLQLCLNRQDSEIFFKVIEQNQVPEGGI